MMNQHKLAGTKRMFYPSILLIAFVSHFIYYYHVFTGQYGGTLYLVILALAALVLGYACGRYCRFTLGTRPLYPEQHSVRRHVYHYRKIKMAGVSFLLIGLAAHLYYYMKNPVVGYGESYTASSGSGYITVFFNFWLLGMIVLELLSAEGHNSGFLKWSNRGLILAYTLFYMLVLLKRRQVIMLFLCLLAIWGRRLGRIQKMVTYIAGIAAFLLFMILGRARGYLDAYGIIPGIAYVVENFSVEWISLEKFEGRYISRTLNDISGYVRDFGYDPSILLGVIFCMVPRKLLGGAKPLAFPEWYTSHFYPADYARGTGYAGSMVGELYLIGGIPLLIVGYFMIGYISARVQKKGRRADDFASVLVYSLYIYTILLLPRYDLASLLIDVVFLYLPLIVCCRGRKVPYSGQEAL